MVASTRADVLNNRSCHIRFSFPFAPSEFCFHAHFWLNAAGLWRPVRESPSDESVAKLENPSEDKVRNLYLNHSPVHSSCQLAIIKTLYFHCSCEKLNFPVCFLCCLKCNVKSHSYVQKIDERDCYMAEKPSYCTDDSF